MSSYIVNFFRLGLVVSVFSSTLVANEWEVQGDIKLGYVNYNYENPPSLSSPTINKGHIDSKGFYTVPKVSLISPTYSNFSAKTTVAGATDFGINDEAYESRNFVFDPTDRKSFAILQELYINYKDRNHNITIGRQELVTPLIEPDDYYMLADSYEAASYINTSLTNYTFQLGYFHKMAGVWDSGANGTEFHSMSETSFVDARDKKNAGDSGVGYVAVEFQTEAHKLKVWEYYITNLYNMFLTQYDFSNKIESFSYELGLQFVNYKEIGKLASNNFTNIDYSIYALKFEGLFDNGIGFATGASKFSDGEGISSTLAAWGGFPTYTYGYIFNWFETGSLQNSLIYKAEIGYDLSKLGLKDAWIGYRYNYYDLDPNHSKTASGDPQDSMQLNGLRVKYNAQNGIYLTLNYEYRVLSNEPDAFAYRIIGGYKF